jgi:hypothetical protein
MPQISRVFTDFVPTLQLFIEEELQGEALFRRLADYHQGKARNVFQIMAAIESGVIAAMQPAIVRHGLELANPKVLYEEGRCEADNGLHDLDGILESRPSRLSGILTAFLRLVFEVQPRVLRRFAVLLWAVVCDPRIA